MARGGCRAGAGRPRKGQEPVKTDVAKSLDLKPGQQTPLEYMLAVMNDPEVEAARRDRMAMAAAPFVHPRAAEVGKKETKADAAKQAAESGRFMTAEPPRSVVAH